MGYLKNGQWHEGWIDTRSTGGKFVRQDASFRNWIENDPGARFGPESGRYQLIVSLACPWACRTVIVRALKGLEDAIGLVIVNPRNLDNGWPFGGFRLSGEDELYNARYLYEFYQRADPDFTGRVTTPTLWDKKLETIVSNESADIMRMLNGALNDVARHPEIDLCPPHLQSLIDEWNERLYDPLNNGVYRAGFATTQEAYEKAFHEVFDMLDMLEAHLTVSRYLTGSAITEADWRLFVTLVRFDSVYYSHFKCNRQRIADYPALFAYLRELYQLPGIAETVQFDHIKAHYYGAMLAMNPTGIVPLGPQTDLTAPHNRQHTVLEKNL